MIRKLVVLILTLVLPLLADAAEPVVDFSPSRTKATVGETVLVDLVMQDFPVNQGGVFSMRFDPSVVQVNQVSVNTTDWNFFHRVSAIDNTNGVVSDIIFASYTGVGGDAVIATVEFKIIKKGRSKLKLVKSEIDSFFVDGENIADIEYGRGVIRGKRTRR